MTALAGILLAGAALFPANATEAQRQARLAPLFAPRPGEPLMLDPVEVRDARRKTSPLRLRGYVTVAPPKGHCLTLSRGEDIDDQVVCERTRVAFALEEMDRAGAITWRVATGDGDAGTDLRWPTPYRLAITEPYDTAADAPPVYELIASCTAARVDGARRIELALLSGKRWVIRLPDEDTLLPQPDPEPNLVLVTSGGKVSVKDASQAKSASGGAKGEHGGSEHGEGKKAGEHGEAKEGGEHGAAKEGGEHGAAKEGGEHGAAKEGGEHGEAKKGEHGEDAAPPPADKPEVPRQADDRAEWAIPLRGAYVMNAAGFMPNGSLPGRLRSLCRYTYKGSAEDPATGRLECHDADGYRMVLVPLTCLAQLGPKRAAPP
jgi:hypothetical protein